MIQSFPDLNIDEITIGLLVLAAVPWLGTLFSSVSLPGGVRINYRDVEPVEQSAERAGLLGVRPLDSWLEVELEPFYVSVAERDPKLALPWLRVELEARLRRGADQYDVDPAARSLRQILRELASTGVLTSDQVATLQELVSITNRAARGAEVSPDTARWAMEVGPQITAALDELFVMGS